MHFAYYVRVWAYNEIEKLWCRELNQVVACFMGLLYAGFNSSHHRALANQVLIMTMHAMAGSRQLWVS